MSVILRLKTFVSRLLWKVWPDSMVCRILNKMHHGQSVIIHGNYNFLPHIIGQCEFFLTKRELEDNNLMKQMEHDIVKSYFLYGTNANEYFCYKFPQRTPRERKSYLPRKKKDTLLMKQMHGQYEYYLNQIKDKTIFYQMAKPLFGRDACRVENEDDLKQFLEFADKHDHFIVKPTRGGCGKGIEILNLQTFGGFAEKAFDYLRKDDESYIVEEIVEQDPRIAEWNSSSLNTIRVPSMRTNKGIVIFYPSIRIGRAGSIVDNAGAGGTFAAIDPKSGIIISDGFDKRGHSFVEHPDSHKKYKGCQIPEWASLIDFTHRLHESMPKEHKYIAFDLALSTKGWVVVEANWGELSMPQIEFGRGLYKEFKDLLYA